MLGTKSEGMEKAPEVSVNLITYNHAPYIRECLDSLLAQETTFAYEICVGEDESTDGTRDICREYVNRYPGRIRLELRSQKSPGREAYASQGVYNYIETTRMCRGKYVALCDGDDIWSDPLKLQKQYDVMEKDPSVALVYSDYDQLDQATGNRICRLNHSRGWHPPVYDVLSQLRLDLIRNDFHIVASTTFMRTADLLDIMERNTEVFRALPMGDTPSWCELAGIGSFHYIEDSLITYRILPHSESNSISAKKRYSFVNRASNLGILLGERYEIPINEIRALKVKNCNRYALLSGDLEEINRLHASGDYPFPPPERMIYLACHTPFVRYLVRGLFMMRYTIKSRLLRAA
ncbi:MAG: glycosyltransferase [Pontiellaceae bacterium]|nr:glycosyltransferase [Pontiellaceae bacterium]